MMTNALVLLKAFVFFNLACVCPTLAAHMCVLQVRSPEPEHTAAANNLCMGGGAPNKKPVPLLNAAANTAAVHRVDTTRIWL